MYFDLWVPLTVSQEMYAQGFLWVVVVSQMFIHSVFDFPESLAYILFAAGFTCDAVNDVGANC